MKLDLFKLIIAKDKAHNNFKTIMSGMAHSAAREMLNQVYNSIPDIDNAFINHFQAEGFDSRLWELYLIATFQEFNFDIIREHVSPDLELVKANTKLFVEAVSTNPPNRVEVRNKLEELEKLSTEDKFLEFMSNLSKNNTIRMATSLRKKMLKKYDELDWVKGNPFVIAIAPFHHSMIHWLSDNDVMNYLYGIDHQWYHDENGKLIIDEQQIEVHTSKNKSVKSGFFNLIETQHISAVIFSNSATISKFNRIGKLKGLGEDKVKMIRIGNAYDHDPNASLPIPFSYIVGENGPKETWAQGMVMFHNPNAKHPIDRDLFPDIVHGYYKDGYYAYIPPFHPINSETHLVVPVDNENFK